MKANIERLQSWWAEKLESLFEEPEKERSAVAHAAVWCAALTYLTIREVVRDRSPMMAAGLAFFTVLAVVPLLTVAASLLMAFGLLEDEGGRIFDTLHRLFPDVAGGLANYLSEVATDSAQAIGGIGAVTLLVIGLVLFNYIEETMTAIWRGRHNRPVVMKIMTFWATLTFGPVLLGLSIVQTARAQIFLSEMGLNVGFLVRLAPVLYALVAFTLIIKLVPDANVSWRSAIVGGLFTAVAFELAKWGFNVYVNQLLLQTYDRVYGTLALIPIGLIWVYITWLVILIGAELAYSVQHMRPLIRAEGGRRSSRARPEQFRVLHPLVPLEVLAAVYRNYDGGQGPVSEAHLVAETGLPAGIVSDIVERLEQSEVLVQVEHHGEPSDYLPAGPASQITLDEIVKDFWVEGHYDGDRRAVVELSESFFDASKAFFGRRTGDALVGDAAERTVDDQGEGAPADG